GPQQQLQRAVNDARAIASTFVSLGFEVVRAENVERGTFNSEWQKFLDKLSPDDTAAINFSGHGVEIERINFLLPRDIPNISYGRSKHLKQSAVCSWIGCHTCKALRWPVDSRCMYQPNGKDERGKSICMHYWGAHSMCRLAEQEQRTRRPSRD